MHSSEHTVMEVITGMSEKIEVDMGMDMDMVMQMVMVMVMDMDMDMCMETMMVMVMESASLGTKIIAPITQLCIPGGTIPDADELVSPCRPCDQDQQHTNYHYHNNRKHPWCSSRCRCPQP